MTNDENVSEQQVPQAEAARPADSSDAARPGLVAGPLRMGIAGLLAGLVAWQLIHWTCPFFAEPIVEEEDANAPTEIDQETTGIVFSEINRKNTAAAGLLLGGLAALIFGVVEGVSQGRVLRAMAITCFSIASGACLGAVGGYCAMTFQWSYWFDPSMTPMKRELGIQGIFWLPMAAGVGLGIALYAGRVSAGLAALVQTVLGAVLFVIIYVPLAGLAFPTDYAESAIPYSSVNTAVWSVLAFGLMGLMLGLARARQKKAA
jgi:hypothetical protein